MFVKQNFRVALFKFFCLEIVWILVVCDSKELLLLDAIVFPWIWSYKLYLHIKHLVSLFVVSNVRFKKRFQNAIFKHTVKCLIKFSFGFKIAVWPLKSCVFKSVRLLMYIQSGESKRDLGFHWNTWMLIVLFPL